jgi:glutamine synthetase
MDWHESYNSRGTIEPMSFPPEEGYMNAVADTDTVSSIPWKSNADKIVMSKLRYRGEAFDLCSRSTLQSVLNELSEIRYDSYLGSDIEFNLLTEFDSARLAREGSDYIEGVVATDLGVPYHARPLDQSSTYFADLNGALKRMNHRLEGIHKESSPGQYEVLTRYSEPLHQADGITLFRMAARGVGRQHDVVPLFVPRPMTDYEGNSQHYHISL